MENNSFICKHGLFHDKPVFDGEPSSNNGWIYTAYAKALGHILPQGTHYDNLFLMCQVKRGDFIANRLPNKTEPPISRDEVIGMAALHTNVIMSLWLTDFSMTRRCVDRISWWKSLKALWKIRNEHRNYVWENKVYDGYKIAFKLMPHDVFYIKNEYGIKPKFYEWLLFQLYALSTILQNNISAKNVLWLQLYNMHSIFWIRFINQPKNFKKYFGTTHIFTRGK